MNPDLAELADRFLDGDVDRATWDQARASHGTALDAALATAKSRRAAIADLPRAPLPPALRDRLLAAAPRSAPPIPGPTPRQSMIPPSPRRGRWWRVGMPAALAAALVVVLLIPGQQPTAPTSGDAPVVAKRDIAERQADAANKQRAEAPAPMMAPAESVLAQRADNLGADTAHEQTSDFAPAQSKDGAKEEVHVAGLSKAAAAIEADDANAGAGAAAPASAAPTLAAEAESKGKPAVALAPAAPVAPARAEGPALLVAADWHVPDKADDARGKRANDAAQPTADLAEATASDERVLRITLRNQGTERLVLRAGSIRLTGLASTGAVLWRTPLRGGRELTIMPGETATWDEPVPVIPPGAARLRVDMPGGRSGELAP